jgi:hypothetical protein
MCCPADYFPEFSACERIHLRDILCEIDRLKQEEAVIIFGGGGLLSIRVSPIIRAVIKEKLPVILWGVGKNECLNPPEVNDFSYLKDALLVGLRDLNSGYNWTPCPSCLAIWPKYISIPISHPFIVFENLGIPIVAYTEFPRLINWGWQKTFCGVLTFLSSGSTIITTSWHGAFWGLCLERKVILWKPEVYTNKFRASFDFLPAATEGTLVELCQLDEKNEEQVNYRANCQRATNDFFNQVKLYL